MQVPHQREIPGLPSYGRFSHPSPVCNKVLRWGAVFFVLLSMGALSSSWVTPYPSVLDTSVFKRAVRILEGVGIGLGCLSWLLLRRSANGSAPERKVKLGCKVSPKKIQSSQGKGSVWKEWSQVTQGKAGTFKIWLIVKYDSRTQEIESITSQKGMPKACADTFSFFVRFQIVSNTYYLLFEEDYRSHFTWIQIPNNDKDYGEFDTSDEEQFNRQLEPVQKKILAFLA